MINKIFYLFVGILLLFIFAGNVYLYIQNMDIGYKQISWQTESFLKGQTDIPKAEDTVDINGKHYWHQPPFPSITLLPFQIIFGKSFNELPGMFLLTTILIIFIYKLIRLYRFNQRSTFFLILVFVFGSVMGNLILNAASWYYSQILATTLLTILVYEYKTRKRYLIFGLLVACLIATRITAATFGLIIIFALFETWFKSKEDLKFLKNILLFLVPIIFSISFLLWFNYIRFGDPLFDTYKASDVNPLLLTSMSKGIFSLSHIPSNIYYGFLTSVIPVTLKNDPNLIFPFITYGKWGISFFLICPFFLYALKNLKKIDSESKGYWLIIIITMIPLLTYYGFLGFVSFGPRYVADFLPILFILVLKKLNPPSLSKSQISFILLSVSFNTYLLLSPHFMK